MQSTRIIKDYGISVFGKHEILVDIYLGYQDVQERPCIVFLHGGGFVGGDKRQFSGMAAYLSLSLNAVCININYRTAPLAVFPSQVIDCLGVCHWINENKTQFKTGCIYLAGGSPGANIAAMTLVNGKNILEDSGITMLGPMPHQGILLNPILDIESFYRNNPSEQNSVNKYLGMYSTYLQHIASPLYYPQKDLSFLILQGSDDQVVGDGSLKAMSETFIRAGSRVEVKTYANESHGWFNYSEKTADVAYDIEKYICKVEGKHFHGINETSAVV